MIILISGFMGSGKTSFLKKLQITLCKTDKKVEFNDLDNEIFSYAVSKLAYQGDSLAQFIKEQGWAKFREMEWECLFRLLKASRVKTTHYLIALGGGTLPFHEMAIGQYKGLFEIRTIWLDVPFEICIQRIKADEKGKRPLLQEGQDFLNELYHQRKRAYSKCDKRLTIEEMDQIKDLEDFFKIFEK